MSRARRLSSHLPSMLFPALLLLLGALFLSCAGGGEEAAPEAESEALAEPAGPSSLELVEAAVAHPDRLEGDLARDADRRPAEVLAFYGIEPGQRVAEIMAATGYYTELLARVVGPEGAVYAQNNSFVLERFAEGPLSERLARPGLEKVSRLDRELEDMGLPEGLDAVLLIRFYHDFYWMGADRAAVNAQVFAALKPGGVYGVLDHHAEVGSKDRDVEELHRVDAEMVKEEILAAGFVLDAESDALANPGDTRDWNIFEDDMVRRDQTDRFIYLFRKPG